MKVGVSFALGSKPLELREVYWAIQLNMSVTMRNMIDFCGQNSFLESYKFTSWDYESVYWSLLIVLTFLSFDQTIVDRPA